tara:strand:- start:98155 stop:98415 length:261 start_codon:yes stop_codon:yes gene_type:complete
MATIEIKSRSAKKKGVSIVDTILYPETCKSEKAKSINIHKEVKRRCALENIIITKRTRDASLQRNKLRCFWLTYSFLIHFSLCKSF